MEKKHIPYGPYERWFKRPLDICCALAAILVFCWLYLLIAILVRIKLGKPVLFTQERPGKDEKIFKLYKFRTMTDARDENGELLPDNVRLTKFGRFLRSTSLDELPEAFNILKGEMSVIGPRPLLIEYLPYYSESEHHRHDVRPGLSGWAQVNGRNFLNWDTRLLKDLEYVSNLSFLFDLKILYESICVMVKRSDVAENTNAVEGNLAEIRRKQMGNAVSR